MYTFESPKSTERGVYYNVSTMAEIISQIYRINTTDLL